MSKVRYLLDEHIDPAVRAQLIRSASDLIVWMIGDPGAPKRGTLDPDLLRWCETYGFLLVTNNRRSMPGHLRDHLASGHHVPGILVLASAMSLGTVLNDLLLIWFASETEEYQDVLLYLPLTS